MIITTITNNTTQKLMKLKLLFVVTVVLFCIHVEMRLYINDVHRASIHIGQLEKILP